MKENTVNKIRKFFKDKPVIKAYLFGSYARKDNTDESDIDILVELDYSKRVGMEFIGMQLDLEKILNKKVDLVSANGVSRYIKPYIDKDKVLIYEK
jgi:hypothetical protein